MRPLVVIELQMELIDCMAQMRKSFAQDSIAGLAQTDHEVGLQSPIRVRRKGNRFLIVTGERRFRAARVAGWKTILAIVEEEPLNEAQILLRQFIENAQQEDLTPIETAHGIEQLKQALGCTAAELAPKVGLSPSSISRYLRLRLLPEDVQQRIHEGKLAASAAYELAKVKDGAKRESLLSEAAADGMTRRAATERARANAKPARKAKEKRARIRLSMGGGLSLTVSGASLDVGVVTDALELLLSRIRELPESVTDLSEHAPLLNRKEAS